MTITTLMFCEVECTAKNVLLPSSQRKSLSKEDLKHGTKQVRVLLANRPQMKGFVRDNDAIFLWTAKQFAGLTTGYRIFWSNSNPTNGASGENQYANHNKIGYIRIAKTDEYRTRIGGEMHWAILVFELHNIANGSKFNSAWNQALRGNLSLEEWILMNTRLEFRAIQNTRNFYSQIWLPIMSKRKIETDPGCWRAKGPNVYSLWIESVDGIRFAEFWKSQYPR